MAHSCQIPPVYGPNVEVQWPILFKISALWGLQERSILAAMCGVISHESASRFWPIHEFGTNCDNCLWDPVFSRYGYAPTGECYGGHGLIQTTWETNHRRAKIRIKEMTGVDYDLLNHPHMILNDPILAAHCACVYWVDHGGGLLIPASKRQDYGEVIRLVWGAKLPGNQYYDQYYARLTRGANALLAI